MRMGAASTRPCPTRPWALRSPRRGCPGGPRWSRTTSPSPGCRYVSGGPWCPAPRPECLRVKLGSPRRIPAQPVDWGGDPRKPRETSIKGACWSQLPLWASGPPPLGSPGRQRRTRAPELFHLRASYSTWCNRAGLLHQLLAVPEYGQSISGTDRASHKEMHVLAVGSSAGDSEMGMVGQ